jgi:hypothetical protein
MSTAVQHFTAKSDVKARKQAAIEQQTSQLLTPSRQDLPPYLVAALSYLTRYAEGKLVDNYDRLQSSIARIWFDRQSDSLYVGLIPDKPTEFVNALQRLHEHVVAKGDTASREALDRVLLTWKSRKIFHQVRRQPDGSLWCTCRRFLQAGYPCPGMLCALINTRETFEVGDVHAIFLQLYHQGEFSDAQRETAEFRALVVSAVDWNAGFMGFAEEPGPIPQWLVDFSDLVPDSNVDVDDGGLDVGESDPQPVELNSHRDIQGEFEAALKTVMAFDEPSRAAFMSRFHGSLNLLHSEGTKRAPSIEKRHRRHGERR